MMKFICALIVILLATLVLSRQHQRGYLYDNSFGKKPINPFCNKDEVCTKNYVPVCANDKRTYTNECEFKHAACFSFYLKKVYDGECGKPANGFCRPFQRCPIIYKPVCGTDGKTYHNHCLFATAACNNRDLKVESIGECGKPPTNPLCRHIPRCPLYYKPVCGSDGQTYSNYCKLANAACFRHDLKIIDDGECEGHKNPLCKPTQSCPMSYRPICGNDGNIYANNCIFYDSACYDPALTKLPAEECDKKLLKKN